MQPGKETFRIAQRFADRVHFGTAKRRSEEPGEFTYDVIYDDGDRETMTLAELEMAKSLFAELSNKDPRSQPEHGEGYQDTETQTSTCEVAEPCAPAGPLRSYLRRV